MSKSTNQAQADSEGRGGAVLVDGRYEVSSSQALPDLDSKTAQAFAANDQKAPGRRLFALVCDGELCARNETISTFARFDNLAIVTPISSGTAFWPPAGGHRYLIVFERPGGARVVASSDMAIPAMHEEELLRKVLQPIAPVLRALSKDILTHRAIRIDNLFYEDTTKAQIMLGEAISAPAGYWQPAVYETIEMAMAIPGGRGPGYQADDFYAFGVLLALLLRGEDPCAGLSDEEIIAAKIESGSYATLLGQTRLSLIMMELLRGLLCDQPADRWSIENLDQWLNGRHLSPLQPKLPPKAARAFKFVGREFWNARSLAHAMARSWDQAQQVVQSPALVDWVRRSLSDEDQANALVNVLSATESMGQGQGIDRIVARVLMVLDPAAPIRYRGFVATVESMGKALAIAYHDPQVRQLFTEIVTGKLPLAWMEAQPSAKPEYVRYRKLSELAAHIVEKSQLGFGIERCLYELNPNWPCQSTMIANDYVCEIQALLPALEGAASRDSKSEPVDRHIVAFCAVRTPHLPDHIVRDLATAEDDVSRRLALLALFAEVQRRTKAPPVAALASYFAGLLAPAIESYHNRTYQRQLGHAIEQAASDGELSELFELIDNPKARVLDQQGFAQACQHFAQATREIAWLKDGGLTNESHVLQGSQQVTTVVSAALSGVMLVAMTVAYVV